MLRFKAAPSTIKEIQHKVIDKARLLENREHNHLCDQIKSSPSNNQQADYPRNQIRICSGKAKHHLVTTSIHLYMTPASSKNEPTSVIYKRMKGVHQNEHRYIPPTLTHFYINRHGVKCYMSISDTFNNTTKI